MHLIRNADESGLDFAIRMYGVGLQTNAVVTGECPFSGRQYEWKQGDTHTNVLASSGRY